MISPVGWLAFVALLIFSAVSWMIWVDYPPFIRLEEQTGAFFAKRFGHPQMNYSDGFFNSLLTFLVTYGSAPFLSTLTVVISLVLFLNGEFLLGIWFSGLVSTGGIFGIFLKRIFQRSRPTNHLARESGYSFPSGHAIASTLFFLSLLLVFLPTIELDWLRYLAMILVAFTWLSILFSRLYFHAHHLGDLLVGVFYGVFWIQIGLFIYQWLLVNVTNYF